MVKWLVIPIAVFFMTMFVALTVNVLWYGYKRLPPAWLEKVFFGSFLGVLWCCLAILLMVLFEVAGTY